MALQNPCLVNMSIHQTLTERFKTVLVRLSGLDSADPIVQVASRPDFGDYQINGIMALAKSLKRPPRELAQEVVQHIDGQGLIGTMEVAGPGFINVTLAPDFICSKLQHASDSDQLGITLGPSQRVVVDYSSVNLAKEMHVGHLRSTIIGDAMARVHEFLGNIVIRQNHVGDWGTQFGMLVAFLVESRKGSVTEADLSDLESFYRQAKARFDDPIFADVARQYVVRLQAGDPEVLALWRHFVEVSMSHCDKVYEQLGVQLTRDDVRGESAYNDELTSLVQGLLDAGIAHTSEGATVVTVEAFKGREGEASAFMVRKKDGGFMYGTTDLAAVRYRAQVLKADRCLYVVDSRQALHFQQLFAVARRAGFVLPNVTLQHVAFGMVLGKDGKPFKTRAGESIKLTDLLREAVERAHQLVMQKNPEMPPQQQHAIAQAVGIGAVKYADLSKNRSSDYVFDWDSMLSFEGNTAPYLQYACVRPSRIAQRARTWDNAIPFSITGPAERALALLLLRFEDTLIMVARDSTPHVLCSYLYELASAYSRFYEHCPIIQEDHLDVGRLKLSNLAGRTLSVGLDLLGIEALHEM